MTGASAYLPPGLPIPVPEPDGLSAPYWAGLCRGELLVQHCPHCRRWQWGPEWICHRCHGFDLDWRPVAGRGRIYSWTRVWHPVHPALRGHGPYLAVLVELPAADGIRMPGNLLGDPQATPCIGAEVEVVFEQHPEADPPYALAQWRLAETPSAP